MSNAPPAVLHQHTPDDPAVAATGSSDAEPAVADGSSCTIEAGAASGSNDADPAVADGSSCTGDHAVATEAPAACSSDADTAIADGSNYTAEPAVAAASSSDANPAVEDEGRCPENTAVPASYDEDSAVADTEEPAVATAEATDHKSIVHIEDSGSEACGDVSEVSDSVAADETDVDDWKDPSTAVAANAPPPHTDPRRTIKPGRHNDEFERGNINLFFGNWGNRGTVQKKCSQTVQERRRRHDRQILKAPCMIIMLCEANQAVVEMLKDPSKHAQATRGAQCSGQSSAVAADPLPHNQPMKDLDARPAYDHFVCHGKDHGDQQSSLLVAVRKNNAEFIQNLEFLVIEDHAAQKAKSRLLIVKIQFKEHMGFIGGELVVCVVHGHYKTMKNMAKEIGRILEHPRSTHQGVQGDFHGGRFQHVIHAGCSPTPQSRHTDRHPRLVPMALENVQQRDGRRSQPWMGLMRHLVHWRRGVLRSSVEPVRQAIHAGHRRGRRAEEGGQPEEVHAILRRPGRIGQLSRATLEQLPK